MASRWDREIEVAVEAVRQASRVCRGVQQKLVTAATLEKKDKSPVTVADFASQAVVCARLAQAFPNDPVIAEEDAHELRQDDHAAVRGVVAGHAAAAVGEAATPDQVLRWIDHGGAGKDLKTSPQRFWTLDPIDGTKGFLRGEQYAVALALIEAGQVVLGVLGCPNLSMKDGNGAVVVGVRGQGSWSEPLEGGPSQRQPVRVSPENDPKRARFCESVESGHSSQDDSQKIAQRLGITADPVRMDSQVKYAAVARGDAMIYLRLPTRKDYTEKVWDHAAGSIVVSEAGGRVTDITGRPLDFTHGGLLAANRGIVATNGTLHDVVVTAVQQTLR